MKLRTMAAALAGAVALPGFCFAATPPVADQDLAHDMLSELISINTVHEQGTLLAAQALKARFLAAGLADSDLTLVAIPGHPNQAQLVVRLRAKSAKARPVLWVGHLDVVEARPEDWTVPPFKLTERDGWWYGRGVQDMKGDDVAVATALIRLKREGFVPSRDLIAAFTSDEEASEGSGVEWLVKNRRDLVDAAFVINPDAGGGAFKNGVRQAYGVQTSEKVYVTFQAEVTNRGGHSSIPEPENAIYRLAEGLGRLARYHFPVVTTPTTRGMFEVNATQETGQTAADMLAVAKVPVDLEAAERLSQTPRLASRLRTTCVATQISGGHAENALPQRARASIQCRMIPLDTEAQTKARLQEVLADPDIKLTVISPAAPAPDSAPDPALFKLFARVVSDSWPGVRIMPHMDLGASDSIFTRAAGIPSYGLSSTWIDAEDNRAHGRDERIRADRFYEGVEFSYRLMKALGQTSR
ncbi:MAG: peptidase M20 [Alphaproteobacteria bacterium PA2]|nr:MAG: peptidase M20 [Alphaproteobacteria bacterium PA2]